MAAAVADFRPGSVAATKLKKGSATEPAAIPLVRNPDVLAELVAARPAGRLVVGFAAETGDDEGGVLDHARAKLARKGCDLLVVNDVSGGAVRVNSGAGSAQGRQGYPHDAGLVYDPEAAGRGRRPAE